MILAIFVGLFSVCASRVFPPKERDTTNSANPERQREGLVAARKSSTNTANQSSPIVEVADSLKTMPETNETIAVDRYPENYVEKFPGLDSYSWLFGGGNKSASLRKFYDRGPYEAFKYDRKLLIELERGGSMYAAGPMFGEKMIPIVKSHRSPTYYFQRENEISSLNEAVPEIPICIINADLARMPELESLPVNSETYHFGIHAFIESVRALEREYSGYRGVRVTFNRNHNGAQMRWIESIDCIVKTSPANPDASKALELVHLNATLGAPVHYGTPESLRKAIGWRSFEELFPGHRLNE